MSSLQQMSSGTEGDTRYEVIDDKKKRRMISNRESARRSRMRKQQRVEDLIRESDQFQRENKELAARINEITQGYIPVASENNVLRVQVMELTDRLTSLNSVLSNIERNTANRAVATPYNGGIPHAGPTFLYPDESQDVGGFWTDVPDPLLKPWQSSCSSQPIIMASASMFQF